MAFTPFELEILTLFEKVLYSEHSGVSLHRLLHVLSDFCGGKVSFRVSDAVKVLDDVLAGVGR